MITTEAHAAIDMTARRGVDCFPRDIFEVLPDTSHVSNGFCWCDTDDHMWTGKGMRWEPGDPAPRFGPEGLR